MMFYCLSFGIQIGSMLDKNIFINYIWSYSFLFVSILPYFDVSILLASQN